MAKKKPKELKRIGVVARSTNREAVHTAAELADWLARRDLEVALDETTLRARRGRGAQEFRPDGDYDLVVVLGGDGTLLSVARSLTHGIPILGINLGTLGFLTEVPRSALYPSLVRVLGHAYSLEERALFDVTVRRAGTVRTQLRAFNDAVISKGALAHIITLALRVDGRLVTRFRSDGLIISTPGGSTAYNLSAGGPIVHPQLPAAILTPICAHTLTLRPVVVPDQGPIVVQLETEGEEVFLSVDGQDGGSLLGGDTIAIARSPHAVQLVRVTGLGFYDSLREKLKWGG